MHLWRRGFLGLRVKLGRAVIDILLALAFLLSFLVTHRLLLVLC